MKRTATVVTCRNCGIVFHVPPSHVGDYAFCSKGCVAEWHVAHKAERFWLHVDRSAGPDACWPWTGYEGGNGYGRFSIGTSTETRNAYVYAHRVALALSEGREIEEAVQDRRDALHSCDNPSCCNPAHLRWGTPVDNANDARSRGRLARGERIRSHRLTADEVRRIRLLYATGALTHQDIAGLFGVSRITIGEAIRRVNWKHLD